MPYSRPTTSRTVDPTELELSMCRPIIGQEPLLILNGLFPRAVEGPSSTGPYTEMKLSLLSDPCVFPMRKQRPIGSLTEFCQMLFLPQQNMGKNIHHQCYLLLLFIYSVMSSTPPFLDLYFCMWVPCHFKKAQGSKSEVWKSQREVFCGFLP